MLRTRHGTMAFLPAMAAAQSGSFAPPTYATAAGQPPPWYPPSAFYYYSPATDPWLVPPTSAIDAEPVKEAQVTNSVREAPDRVLLATVSLVLLLSAPVFQVGAYGEIFFDVIMSWAFVLISLLLTQTVQRKWVGGRWYGTLAAVIASAGLLIPGPTTDPAELIYTVVVGTLMLATAPLVVRVVFKTLGADASNLTKAQAAEVLVCTTAVLVLSFLVGLFHATFLTCDDFSVAGYREPSGCRNGSLY